MSAMIDAIEVPETLSTEFFKKSLENGLKLSQVKIKKINFTNGSSGGENYCSQIFRSIVTYSSEKNSDKEIPLIVKYMPMEGERDILDEMQVYKKELSVYLDIIPEMEKIIGNESMIAPRCYYAVSEPVKTIVFEDLTSMGFKLADRVDGLDRKHSEVVLNKIGQFHALSMVMARMNPELMESFNISMFHGKDSPIKEELFRVNLAYLADHVETWNGFDQISKKLRTIRENFFKRCIKCVESGKDGIRVLNHGDLWVNNFMFKYDQGTPTDLAFLDFQIAYYSSPGHDLNYFFNTSVQLDVLKKYRYELLQTYYMSFSSSLKRFNFDRIPTWEEIKNEIRSREFYGFAAFEGILPLIAMDKERSQDNSLESLSDAKCAQQKRVEMFKSERMHETLKYALMRFDELGVLD